jgi:putative hydrolase of the HAD superfamily
MNSQGIEALIFDFGGVLSKTLFETHSLTEAALGLPKGSLTWRGPFADLGDEPDHLWQSMQRDEISERQYWHIRSKEVGDLLGENWTDMQTLVQRSRGAEPNLVIRPEAILAVEKAKRLGLRLAVLSNELDLFYGAQLRRRLKLLESFELIVDATYTGVLKPLPDAYLACLSALNLVPEQCVFIDDQKRNIEGARQVGLQCVEFDVRQPAKSFEAVFKV